MEQLNQKLDLDLHWPPIATLNLIKLIIQKTLVYNPIKLSIIDEWLGFPGWDEINFETEN